MNSKERISEFIRYRGIGQAAFEKEVGISNGYVNNLKGSIGSNIIQKISEAYPELNTDWLIKGDGEMLKSPDSVVNNPENADISESLTQISDSDMKSMFKQLLNALERRDELAMRQQLEYEKQGARIDRLIGIVENTGGTRAPQREKNRD